MNCVLRAVSVQSLPHFHGCLQTSSCLKIAPRVRHTRPFNSSLFPAEVSVDETIIQARKGGKSLIEKYEEKLRKYGVSTLGKYPGEEPEGSTGGSTRGGYPGDSLDWNKRVHVHARGKRAGLHAEGEAQIGTFQSIFQTLLSLQLPSLRLPGDFAEGIGNIGCENFDSELVSRKTVPLQIPGSVHSEYSTSPGELIIFSVDRYHGNQVVMGSRGLGIVRRSILGSVSQYVLDHSRVPVTVIPRDSVKSWFI